MDARGGVPDRARHRIRPAGTAGAPGPRGDTGAPGVATLGALAGSPCEDHTGRAGTITIATSAADDVVLHCSAGAGGSGGPPGDQPPVHLLALSFERFDATHYTVTVALDHTVAQDTSVTLTSADTTSVVVPGTVTVLTGQSSASRPDVTIIGSAGAEITATLNGETIHATLTPN